MKILRKNKKELINPLKKEMKKRFAKKQLRFALSKVAKIFYEDNVDISTLIKAEKMILEAPIDKTMFVKSFQLLATDKVIDWESFGKMMWYCYQTSTYWQDEKKNKKNIYNQDNYVKLNEIRRKLYHNWLFSIPKTTPHFNFKIIKIMKVVF